MLQVVVLGQVLVAVLFLATSAVGESQRVRAIQLGAPLAGALGVLLFLIRNGATSWSSLAISPGPAALTGAAIVCAWALVFATDEGRGRWDVAALVGAGAAGLVGFATTAWIAPAVLFWIATSAAAVVASRGFARSRLLWLSVGLSDVCVVGGFVAHGLVEETWRLPTQIDTIYLYPLVAGVILRAMALPRAWGWSLVGTSEMAVFPLLVGSGFAVIHRVSDGGDIWVGLPLLALAVASAAWCILRPSLSLSLLGPWVTALMLAVVWIEPLALGKAATAALLGLTALALWPLTAGRSQSERGLILAAVPATVGFGAIVGGAVASFERAAAMDSVLDSAPWSAFAALLPVALAAGVTVGAGIGRRSEAETYHPVPVLTTWGIAALALILGLSPTVEVGFSGGRAVGLSIIAVLAGVAAARFAPKRSVVIASGGEPAPLADALELPASLEKALPLGGLALAFAALLATLWFTYTGLRAGFL